MGELMTFNPITKCITRLKPQSLPQSFQHWCKKSIITTIGLKNLHKVDDLPLPERLKSNMAALSLEDFLIEANKLDAQAHTSDVYPATCLLTDSQVNLRILPADETVNTNDLRLLTWFEEQDQLITVEEPTRSLSDTIHQCRENHTVIEESFIWLLLDELVQYLQEEAVSVTTHLAPDCVHFLPNHQAFIEINDYDSNQAMTAMTSVTVYESPEVLMNTDPDSRALVWSIGCILYEAVALEPAFYDKTGNNPFQVTMQIMAGQVPSVTALSCSQELRDVISQCIVHDVNQRITLQQLSVLAKSKNVKQ